MAEDHPQVTIYTDGAAVCEKHTVTFEWVPGHRGVSENGRCDRLAAEAAKSSLLAPDVGYLTPSQCPARVTDPSANPKSKVTEPEPGDLCRHCGAALVKAIPKWKKRKPTQEYYYEWYLRCPGCRRMFMVEAGKRQYDEDGSTVIEPG